jgi:two-component system response regulator AgrA
MLEIYICEDNEPQRAFVTGFVHDYCTVKGLDAAVSLSSRWPQSLLEQWGGQNPALFILDIDLKAEMNGIEMASRIREQGKAGQKVFIVFLTTHTEMTMLTFQYKVEALDFIPKDNPDNIKKRIGDCIDTVMQRSMTKGKANALQLAVDDKVIFIDMDDIIFMETTHVRHKLRLHTANRVLEFNGELKAIEGQLDKRFIRCHKSFVINKEKIAAVNKRANTVIMVHGGVCPISRAGMRMVLAL